MAIDSPPQPCPQCLRPTVLVSKPWGRQWLHTGTWQAHCERHRADDPHRPRPFRRTPTHCDLLKSVAAHRIHWHNHAQRAGTFATQADLDFQPGEELVALYELRNAGLITVNYAAGTVAITAEGRRRLEQWTLPTQLPRAS